jgi:hypothetical protein
MTRLLLEVGPQHFLSSKKKNTNLHLFAYAYMLNQQQKLINLCSICLGRLKGHVIIQKILKFNYPRKN